MFARASYLALLGLALVLAGCDSGATEPEAVLVTYRVSPFGTLPAATADLSYDDADGRRQTVPDAALPWTRQVEFEAGGQAYLSAVSESTSGALGMRVEVLADGEVVDAEESDGTTGPGGTQQLALTISTTVR